jgi:hypothetical protein
MTMVSSAGVFASASCTCQNGGILAWATTSG